MPRLYTKDFAPTGRAVMIERLERRQMLSYSVNATAETAPMPNGGDASDDMAVWIHPTNPALSTIIGTDGTAGSGGLAVYDLSGRQLQFRRQGDTNNVDLRDGFRLGGKSVSLVAASLPDERSVAFYKVNPETRLLEDLGKLRTGVARAYGLAMYHSQQTGKFYVFVSDPDGALEQWEVFDNGAGGVAGRKVRAFDVGLSTEGMVADDKLGDLYVAEETRGIIWKYGAEPQTGAARTQVDSTSGHLTADVEGLAIYDSGGGKGYLIASSQGSNDFAVYEREGDNDYLTRFNIGGGLIDGVADADGIEVVSGSLGADFPSGLFAAQDGNNGGQNINFKLVSWESIAHGAAPDLTVPDEPAGNPTPDPDPGPTPDPDPGPDPTPDPDPAPVPDSLVTAMAETEVIPGGSADDVAIWTDPNDPSRGAIVAVGSGGLRVYNLAGEQLQVLSDDQFRNVDLVQGYELNGQSVALVAATDATHNTLALFMVDAKTRSLVPIVTSPIHIDGTVSGVALYHSKLTGLLYAFVNTSEGQVEQWKLHDNGSGGIEGDRVRHFRVGSGTEGMIADHELGNLYISEEKVGIWKYGAEPETGIERTLVDRTTAGGHLTADAEGLAIYYGENGDGYLIASSQGSNDFVLYRRTGDNDFVRRFAVSGGAVTDRVSGADGIAVASFGPGAGLFVTSDHRDNDDGENFKLVAWDEIDPLLLALLE